mmetsp:Transcript_13621/g.14157  ORF Transcript_13621/g.14157 Transcript_13621/m.14157 type:complete len:356 (+) Transcript_13621:89-1156(+)
MSDLVERIAAAKKQVESLKKQVESAQAEKLNGFEGLNTKASNIPNLGPTPKVRRTLRGHFGKVYALHWSGDSQHLVSASQDGKLMIWNGLTTNKIQSIPLASSWVITCAYEQSANRLVACGGMDNICSLYKVERGGQNKVVRVAQELSGHHGYLSSCSFIDETNILTASGDSTCNLWDIERGRPIRIFKEHTADVMSVSVSKVDPTLFLSGSCDTTTKLWDIRSPNRSILTLRGHTSDVNSVHFFPDGYGVGTGSDDRTCKFFDTRCLSMMSSFGNESIVAAITSVSFSKSGRFLFGGYEDHTIRVWDIFADPTSPASCRSHLTGHENRVSSLSINPAGDALLTGSWDTMLRIWA